MAMENLKSNLRRYVAPVALAVALLGGKCDCDKDVDADFGEGEDANAAQVVPATAVTATVEEIIRYCSQACSCDVKDEQHNYPPTNFSGHYEGADYDATPHAKFFSM